MCGRFVSHLPPEEARRWFRTTNEPPNYPPRWNAAPSLDLPVVRFDPRTRERRLDLLCWGLVPSFAKDARGGAKLINARAETVMTQPAFRAAFARRRCLVVADGFYEWRRDGKTKQPYAIALASGDPIGLAGLWEGWKDPTGWLRTFSIITTRANSLLEPLHHRMPVVVHPSNYGIWLGETGAGQEELAGLLQPYPPEEMAVWRVSDRVNNVRNEGADLLQPESG